MLSLLVGMLVLGGALGVVGCAAYGWWLFWGLFDLDDVDRQGAAAMSTIFTVFFFVCSYFIGGTILGGL